MKTLICVTVIWSAFFIAGAPPVRAQTGDEYTFVATEKGPQVCLGRWVQPADVALAGFCQGQMMGLSQLAAISAKQSVDKLDQLILTLSSIDEKLAVSNDQLNLLIQATVGTQTSIDRQVRQVSEFLRETITKRFDALSADIMANDRFREEITKLKEDILKEVEKYYSSQPKPAAKP